MSNQEAYNFLLQNRPIIVRRMGELMKKYGKNYGDIARNAMNHNDPEDLRRVITQAACYMCKETS